MNKILIKIAVFFLERVDISKIKYKNSFRHYKDAIKYI